MNPLYRTSPQLVVRAALVAVVIGVVVGVAWGYQPTWSFWFAIGCGFAIAETMVRVTGAKRGSTYQMIGIIGVVVCVVVSRVVVAQRLGVGVSDILNVLGSSRLGDPRSARLFHAMALDLPNFVYIGLAVAIPFIRFR